MVTVTEREHLKARDIKAFKIINHVRKKYGEINQIKNLVTLIKISLLLITCKDVMLITFNTRMVSQVYSILPEAKRNFHRPTEELIPRMCFLKTHS